MHLCIPELLLSILASNGIDLIPTPYLYSQTNIAGLNSVEKKMNSLIQPRIGDESNPRSNLPNPNEMNSGQRAGHRRFLDLM
jgi:hypothetical protein